VPAAVIDLCAVIVSTMEDKAEERTGEPTGETPSILVVRGEGGEALPSGPFDAKSHRTLDRGLHLWVETQTGLALEYAEQLYTFGDMYRDPVELAGGPRHVSVGYVALVRASALPASGDAAWIDWYEFFPWEDWRNGPPPLIDNHILPRLDGWVRNGKDAAEMARRRERLATTFGMTDAGWDVGRVLERYELLYHTRSVLEALRDDRDRGRGQNGRKSAKKQPKASIENTINEARRLGRPMVRDHRRILATAMSRIRGKLTYRPVVFDLLPHTFTLLHLQKTVEALTGTGLHKQNFRRMVINGKLVEATGKMDAKGAGRPAELYRFRPDVLGEQLAPGVGKFGRR
jgi:hypothetical protein